MKSSSAVTDLVVALIMGNHQKKTPDRTHAVSTQAAQHLAKCSVLPQGITD